MSSFSSWRQKWLWNMKTGILNRVGHVLGFRMIYVLWRFPCYGKIGISRTPTARAHRIDRAVKGKVLKIIALPFFLAARWEALLLLITSPFARRPPTVRGFQTEAGGTEWRWLPGSFIIFPLLVMAAFIVQVHLIVWVITFWRNGEPFSVLGMIIPYLVAGWEILTEQIKNFHQ